MVRSECWLSLCEVTFLHPQIRKYDGEVAESKKTKVEPGTSSEEQPKRDRAISLAERLQCAANEETHTLPLISSVDIKNWGYIVCPTTDCHEKVSKRSTVAQCISWRQKRNNRLLNVVARHRWCLYRKKFRGAQGLIN